MDEHQGDIIPAAGRAYAYENERVRTELTLTGFPAEWVIDEHGRKQRNPDIDLIAEYELTICRNTGNSLHVCLRKKFRGNELVRTRIANGAGTTEEVFTTTMSFAELCNRLLGPGCSRLEETEAFPDSVRKAMKEAYQ